LQSIPTSQVNPFLNITGQFNAIDINSAKDKLLTAGSQIAQVSGQLPVVDKNILGSVTAKFGSGALGASPLSKLLNGNNIG
jgi:hypothetical protein